MILAAAPLRVSFGGGGTDLPSYYERWGGYVLSGALDWFIYTMVNHTVVDDLIRLKYSESEEVRDVHEIAHPLIRNAMVATGVTSNIEITTVADMPERTGLGSSGTYLVALMLALARYRNRSVKSPMALAEAAYYVERILSGHTVGKHDHYMAAYGGITCLTIAQSGDVLVQSLDITPPVLHRLRRNLLLFYTDIRRSSQPILVAQKDATTSGSQEMLDSLHEIKEIGLKVTSAFLDGRLHEFGCLLDEHWEIKKTRAAHMTRPDIDQWYQRALDEGAVGGKIVGAGGGGVLMLYVEPAHQVRVRAAMFEEGLRELCYNFEPEGARILLRREPKGVNYE